MSNDNKIVVFGAGSIGERHIGILQELGFENIWVYRQRMLPMRNIDADRVQVFTDLERVEEIQPLAAIICTPTAQHLEQARYCAERGIHVLVEKPLTHTPAGLDELKEALRYSGSYLQVAYMLRYHPLIERLHTGLQAKEWGDLLSMQTYWGEYLPDWHPWEDYRHSYAARSELGGGVTLTLSHDLDLVNWLANSPVAESTVMAHYQSPLEVDVESGADITFCYENGITAHCHLNYYERVPRRYYRFICTEASIEIDYFRAEMRILQPRQEETLGMDGFERNDMFRAQMRDFFRRIHAPDRTAQSLRAIEESRAILRVVPTELSDV